MRGERLLGETFQVWRRDEDHAGITLCSPRVTSCQKYAVHVDKIEWSVFFIRAQCNSPVSCTCHESFW
jgi:hypothetical protein